jgi:AraC-like DNA-binding protein
MFAGRVRFGQAHTGIGVSHALLARPLGTPNPALFEALQHQALRLHERLDTQASMQSRVARLVRAALPLLPSMREAAQALALSERSLRRRLADEGTSYTQVAEAVRLNVARELLGSRERPLKQIASELGFSELSAFHRAFKRWTGDTPVAFRERGSGC